MTERDRLMICSDGISNELSDDEISALIVAATGLEAAASGVVAEAVARGGHDNASVVVAELSG